MSYPRGIKMQKKVKTKAQKYEKRKLKRIEKKRQRRAKEEKEKLLMQRTLEIRHIKRLFPDSEYDGIRVSKIPVEMKQRFEAFCLNRGYTAAGRLRKFIHDCTTGVIKE